MFSRGPITAAAVRPAGREVPPLPRSPPSPPPPARHPPPPRSPDPPPAPRGITQARPTPAGAVLPAPLAPAAPRTRVLSGPPRPDPRPWRPRPRRAPRLVAAPPASALSSTTSPPRAQSASSTRSTPRRRRLPPPGLRPAYPAMAPGPGPPLSRGGGAAVAATPGDARWAIALWVDGVGAAVDRSVHDGGAAVQPRPAARSGPPRCSPTAPAGRLLGRLPIPPLG